MSLPLCRNAAPRSQAPGGERGGSGLERVVVTCWHSNAEQLHVAVAVFSHLVLLGFYA